MTLLSFISTFGRKYPVYIVLCALFSNDKTKSLYTLWKFGSIEYSLDQSKYKFGLSRDILDWYLFQLIVCLSSNFNCCSNVVLSWVDKLTTRTKSFVSIIAKFVALLPSEFTQFSDQVRIILMSQLINCISRVLQKLQKYFNGAAIFAFIIPAVLVFSRNFHLNLNDSDSVMSSFSLS